VQQHTEGMVDSFIWVL